MITSSSASMITSSDSHQNLSRGVLDGGGGDSLPAPPRAGESQEAAQCLPKRAAYVGRRRPGLRRARSVSRLISCSTTDFPTRMLLTCEGGALLLDSLLWRGLGLSGTSYHSIVRPLLRRGPRTCTGSKTLTRDRFWPSSPRSSRWQLRARERREVGRCCSPSRGRQERHPLVER